MRLIGCAIATAPAAVGAQPVADDNKPALSAPLIRLDANSNDNVIAGLPVYLSWMGNSVEQTRARLSPDRYGSFYADFAMTIAPYSKAVRLSGVQIPGVATLTTWEDYRRFAMTGGAASSAAVTTELTTLDKALTSGDRRSLFRELLAVFNKYK